MNFLVDMPTWVSTDEARAFIYGFCMGAMIRIFRATTRWVKNMTKDTPGTTEG